MGIVAAVQAPSVYFDALASARRAAEHLAAAAEAGAWLAVFSESYIPGYPDWVWRVPAVSSSPSAEPFATFQRRFLEQAITIPGPETDIIAAACRKHRVMAAVGVTERPARAGTLYNTLLYFGADGAILGRHRKLVPTFAERIAWGAGDGTTLRTIEPAQALLARRGFDAVGHYGRGDVFKLVVEGIHVPLQIGDCSPMEQMPETIWRVVDKRQPSLNKEED